MYKVGQRMNIYFVDFFFHPWIVVVYDLPNATKGNLVANVIYD
jgi:hypothetical protein